MMQKYSNADNSVAFEYDDEQFQHVGDGRLKYIGTETDGSKIQVPEGLVDGTALFEDTKIKSGAQLPNSLRKMTNMYRGCIDMTDPGVIPDAVTDIDGAYSYTGIKDAPYMPDSVETSNFAFDHCEDLERCQNFSKNMKHAVCMFSGDKSLKELPEELPDALIDMDGFACACPSLVNAPKTGKNVKNMSNAYASDVSLENMPEIPEGAYAENVVTDCYTLEHQNKEKSSLSAAFQAADEHEKSDKPMNREAALSEITDSIESAQNDSPQLEK